MVRNSSFALSRCNAALDLGSEACYLIAVTVRENMLKTCERSKKEV
jgi:hypothetical protein